MSKYILNIKTGKIHDGVNPCYQCKKSKEGNKKFFDNYDEALNFFEGETSKGEPCGICLKEKDR